MNKRICTSCNEEKDLDCFSFRNKLKQIKSFMCKSCKKIKSREAHEKRRDEIRHNRKERKSKIKKWFDEYRSNLKCAHCPENHIACLDFHHLNKDEKYREVSWLVAQGWGIEVIEKEIEKCIVLCSNCHRKLHFNEK